MEECAGREGAGAEVEDGVEGRGRKRDSAKVQIGAELLCKSGKVGRWEGGTRVQSTDYGEVALTVQRCKSAYGLCEGGKVESDFRVRSTDYGGKVGAWLCRALVMFRRAR